MNRRWTQLALATLLAACDDGPPIADIDVELRQLVAVERATVDGADVEFGQAFPLTVTRIWRKELEPEEWRDETLAPLVVRRVLTRRRESARHIEEVRRFDAYAFQRDALTVPARQFTARARSDGSQRAFASEALTLRVRSALGAGPPGAIELPGEMLEEPRPWRLLALGGGAVLVILAGSLVAWRRRRAAIHRARLARPLAVAIAPAPHLRALARLRRLRATGLAADAAVETEAIEAAAAVRDYVVEQFAVPAPARTTEEVANSPGLARAIAAAPRSTLAGFLTRCDQVKFACHVPSGPERIELLDAAEAFVQETAR